MENTDLSRDVASEKIEEAAKCFSSARMNIVHGAALLYEIKKKNLWKGRYDSFGEFVEDGCKIGQAMASKLVSVYSHYIIEGHKAQEDIIEIDHEKLYMLIKSPNPVDEKILEARKYSRIEIRRKVAIIKPHVPDYVAFCRICGLSPENHADPY
jgi:hypothetical protein